MARNVSHELFRERVKLVLARSGLSFAAFARQARLDRSTLSQLLAGPMPRLPRAETLAAIAEAAHVSVDWLLGLSQREELGAEIIEAVMKVEPYGASPAHDSFLAWLKAAQGQRICTVPFAMPDVLKNEAVLRLEYAAGYEAKGMTPSDAVRLRLDMLRQPHQQLELAVSRDAFTHFALGIGLWSGLDADERRAAFDHAIALAEALYPALRIYLFDPARTYSIPFTVFGAQRVAIFLGSDYLVLNAAGHIEMFARRFDDLIRAASVQPHQFADTLREMCALVR